MSKQVEVHLDELELKEAVAHYITQVVQIGAKVEDIKIKRRHNRDGTSGYSASAMISNNVCKTVEKKARV